MVYKFFYKKSTAEPSALARTGSGFKKLKNTARNSSILADERHKTIRKFNKIKVYLQFKDNKWGVGGGGG